MIVIQRDYYGHTKSIESFKKKDVQELVDFFQKKVDEEIHKQDCAKKEISRLRKFINQQGMEIVKHKQELNKVKSVLAVMEAEGHE